MEEMLGRSSFLSVPLASAQSLSLDCLCPFASLPVLFVGGGASAGLPLACNRAFSFAGGGHLWLSLDMQELQGGLPEMAPRYARWVAWTSQVV